MNKLLVWLLRAYQLLLSPMLGQSCRFYPTCSNYAIEAIRTHGAARGAWLSTRRVCKCHPWHDGGVDLVPPVVPPARDKNSSPTNSSSTARGCNHS
ncbi:membrane protein insertion efficiency factor YidD [Massilia eurypsychrophila]|uniref:Putative membrane protein insertion efficiency factor n=1 Tax=Massilia eurypsychrophila TaxID=1485217 RepID=A0A2G8TKP2_9BURK|nr:membrane protein insertion efficiency factor YidD [Massilia eurypsychrophila]PIL46602.1 membrane protein insertion efficiency factor YidD [Massilia eurypsychrophila]